MFIAVLFTIARIWKQTKRSSVNEWVKRMWYVCIVEYSAIKSFWQHGWIWEHYAKGNEADNDKYYMISLICRILTKLNWEKESRLVVVRGWEWGKGRCWSKGTNFQYKVNKFSMVTIVNNRVLYKVAKK